MILTDIGAPITPGVAVTRALEAYAEEVAVRVKVLIRESIAEAGVELLRKKFDVDVDAESPLEEIIGDYDGSSSARRRSSRPR